MVRMIIVWTLVTVMMPAASHSAPAAAAEIVINLPAFTLYVYSDGVPTATYPIGVGGIVNPSQLGATRIVNEVYYPTYYPPDWYTKGLKPVPPGPDNPVGTRWLGLGFKGYGIHGTNQPLSIGTAASAGCIRMHNRDVEALAEFVGVGTPVTFLYETLEAWRDPVSGRPFVRVYPDIYKQERNRYERLSAKLNVIGASRGADPDFLRALLEESAGEARPVPISVPLLLGGRRLHPAAVQYGERMVLSLNGLAEELGDKVAAVRGGEHGDAAVSGRVVPRSFFMGEQAYAPVAEAAEAFGLITLDADDSGVSLEHVELMGEDQEGFNVRTYVMGRWLLLPVQEVSRRLGLTVGWNPDLQAVIVDGRPAFGVQLIGGKAYLPHDRLSELLGVRIRWSPGELRATLGVASVRIFGAAQTEGERGFVHDGQVFVPLRLVTDHLGYTLGWNQNARTAYVHGQPVSGVVRDGRVYTSLSALSEVVPRVHYVWDEEEFQLTLSLDERLQAAGAEG